MKKTLHDVKVQGKTVLVRVDFNVPMKDGQITDDNRIIAAMPTIKYLLENKAKVVLFSHLSRIKEENDKTKKSLKPIAKKLEEISKEKVIFIPHTRGAELEKAIKNLKESQILLLENTRFEDVLNNEVVKYESKNNSELGKYWASLGDIFVNDAFGTAHRAHASNVGIASNIKESCVGLLVQKEIEMLTKGIKTPEHPFVAIIGGAKVSDKIGVIDNLLTTADKVIIGGGMAYTFLKSQGKKIGLSLCEDDKMDLAASYLKKSNGKIILPIDYSTSKEFKDIKPVIMEGDIPDDVESLDIGPKTIKLFQEELKGAKTVAWNGPMGVFEFENFKTGTVGVCEAIAKLDNAFTLIGGGDSAAAAIQLGYKDKFTHISTGGGASLEFMEGKTLPGIEAISNK